MLKVLSVFAALNLCTTVAMAAGRVVPSRSVADSVRSEETTRNTADRAGQSKNSRGVATREVPKVVTREGAKSNENSAGANARRGANADSDSRTTNARTQRSATATRSVANARGGATAAKSTATATASRVATTNVARTANRSVKSDVAKGVRASVTGLYTGFTPPQGRSVTTARVATKRQSMVPGAASSSRATRARATVQGQAEIEKIIENLTTQSSLKKSCQEQYTECMDQFCNTLDEKQGRCSCSANLSRYAKSEEAVKEANARLNEVAQNIRYIGLSADEIRSIMSETEAESALAGTADTSETRNMLDKIEDLIRDPTSSNSYVADNFTDFTLDLDFTSDDNDDLFSLDFFNMGNSSSFSNLRGTDLYKAAKKRCNSILTQCKQAGATSDLISGNYDLAIDKDCLAYEQGLQKMNDSLTSNVRSATQMLQKARLAVRQNKNQYDAKGCVAALDKCMTDDMVCGADYFKCVDPTKNFIDENGEVILGQDITKIIGFMKNYNNAKIDDDFLDKAYSQVVSVDICAADKGVNSTSGNNDGSCIAKYLLQKIGTKQNVTDEGLCRAVLDKCQNYTYDKNDNYKRFNDVVVNYVQRAMVNINAAQRQIISDYASSCITDIASCYNQQVSQVNTWSSNASVANIHRVMSGACRNVALTCAYAVFDGDKKSCSSADKCIENISQMFYQSLLCPDNSVYQTTASSTFGNGTSYVNAHCMCASGYKAQGSACVESGTGGSGNGGSSSGGGTTEQPEDGTDDVTPINFSVYDENLGQVVETVTVEAYGAQVVDIVKYLQSSSEPVTKVTVKRDGLKYIVTADNDDVDWVSICPAAGATRVNSSCEASLEKTVAFGGTCTEAAECSTKDAVCTSGKCACKLGQTYSASSNSCGTSGGTSGDGNVSDGSLGSACNSSANCTVTNSECSTSTGTCVCKSGYYESGGSCEKQTQTEGGDDDIWGGSSPVGTAHLGQACSGAFDCIGENVHCSSSKICACDAFYGEQNGACVFTGELTPGARSAYDVGGVCNPDRSFSCRRALTWCGVEVKGACSCVKLTTQHGDYGCVFVGSGWGNVPLGGACTYHSDCATYNSTCSYNNKCECLPGFYQEGNSCAEIDVDDTDFGWNNIYAAVLGGVPIIESALTKIKNSIVIKGIIECEIGYVPNFETNTCEPDPRGIVFTPKLMQTGLGEDCDILYGVGGEAYGCDGCRASYPLNGWCFGHTIPVTGTDQWYGLGLDLPVLSTVPGILGTECDTASDCVVAGSTCGVEGYCVCKSEYAVSSNGKYCVKQDFDSDKVVSTTYGRWGEAGKDLHRKLGGACDWEDPISFGCLTENSYCTSRKICACKHGYRESNGECVRDTSAPCPPGQILYDGSCRTFGDGILDTTCDTDGECYYINAYCGNSPVERHKGRCSCDDNHYEIDGECVMPKYQDSSCSNACPENSTCNQSGTFIEGTIQTPLYACKCDSGFTMSEPGVCVSSEFVGYQVKIGGIISTGSINPGTKGVCPWGTTDVRGAHQIPDEAGRCVHNYAMCGNYCKFSTNGLADYDYWRVGGEITDGATQCPSTADIEAEWAEKGWNWKVVRTVFDGMCSVVVQQPEELGGLCFAFSGENSPGEAQDAWYLSERGPDGLPSRNYQAIHPHLTVCDATWHRANCRYGIWINDADLQIEMAGGELRVFDLPVGQGRMDLAVSISVGHGDVQVPDLTKWVEVIEKNNPDKCFLGGGTQKTPGGTYFWNSEGVHQVDLPCSLTGPAYKELYLWWGSRSAGECE